MLLFGCSNDEILFRFGSHHAEEWCKLSFNKPPVKGELAAFEYLRALTGASSTGFVAMSDAQAASRRRFCQRTGGRFANGWRRRGCLAGVLQFLLRIAARRHRQEQ